MQYHHVSYEKLNQFCVECFKGYGFTEAQAQQITDVLDVMNLESGYSISALSADGGGSKNSLLMQLQADLAKCSLRNKFSHGDTLEAVGPDMRPFPVTIPMMQTLEGEPLEEPKTPQMRFYIQLPRAVPAMSMLRKNVDLSPK